MLDVPSIHSLLIPEHIRVGLPGHTKEEVIEALIDVLRDDPAMLDPAAARAAVLARENLMSTGVGKGLGLPHAKTTALSRTLAAFAVTAEPVDFDALDGRPVRLVFLLIGTETARAQHIKILSRLSRLMNRAAFRARLLEAPSPKAVHALFEDAEMELVVS